MVEIAALFEVRGGRFSKKGGRFQKKRSELIKNEIGTFDLDLNFPNCKNSQKRHVLGKEG